MKKYLLRYKPDSALICSVVPQASKKVRKILKENKIRVYECGKEIKVPVRNLYKYPEQVGQDRLVNVYAAKNLYRSVCLIIDLGTAVTFDFISKKGDYSGGLIFPGVSVSYKSLLDNCALLPKKLKLKPKNILKSKVTADSLCSGVTFGYSFLLKGLTDYIKKKQRSDFKVLITGGDAGIILKDIACPDYIEPCLCLKGLQLLSRSI